MRKVDNMSITECKRLKMTLKTRIYLKLYHFFDWFNCIPQYFITHCDCEDAGELEEAEYQIEKACMSE
jgi:hypothetical protein